MIKYSQVISFFKIQGKKEEKRKRKTENSKTSLINLFIYALRILKLPGPLMINNSCYLFKLEMCPKETVAPRLKNEDADGQPDGRTGVILYAFFTIHRVAGALKLIP